MEHMTRKEVFEGVFVPENTDAEWLATLESELCIECENPYIWQSADKAGA